MKKISFQKKLFFYLSLVLLVFTIFVLVFQFEREKNFRKRQLETTLDDIAVLTHNYIKANALYSRYKLRNIDSIKSFLPKKDVRITVIQKTGKVIYDSDVDNFPEMENHINRPEIVVAKNEEFGSNIRQSETTGLDYYYYAKKFPDYFIRTAAHYDVSVKYFLKIEKLFIFYLVLLFIVMWLVLLFLTRNLTETITKLKDFIVKLNKGKEPDTEIFFPSDELGTISKEIFSIYNKLNKAKNKISLERNKLFSHLQVLNEGIAFFSPEKEKILMNKQFLNYMNLISSKLRKDPTEIFKVGEFSKVVKFIDNQQHKHSLTENKYEENIKRNNKHFNIQCVIFEDKSFEIVIKDNTKLEKRKIMKQQMTSNIAHELKTPVATVMGYLETLTNNNLPQGKKSYFINKAFVQAQRLSELISDISMLNKIEEAKEMFDFEKVLILDLIEEVIEHLNLKLQAKNIKIKVEVDEFVVVNGSKTLLFSVFFNLFDNAIKYGDKNGTIFVKNYMKDKKMYYFSFANIGENIDSTHFTRLFERFYRIDDGRSRKTGGTGLGLAIVKNAVQLHNGTISARNFKQGGLEFLFSIEK